MPRTRKDEAPLLVDEPIVSGRYADVGPYTVGYETYPTDFDPSALFVGLPDDRCQCPHWGVVVSGKLVVTYADRSEMYIAGDAYYVEPGHLPHPHAGTEVVEFSPTDALQATMAVIGANMAPHGAAR